MKQNCGNCAHAPGWWLTPSGRFKKGTSVRCEAPVEIPALPDAVKVEIYRIYVRPGDGTDCKIWSKK